MSELHYRAEPYHDGSWCVVRVQRVGKTDFGPTFSVFLLSRGHTEAEAPALAQKGEGP